MRILLLEWDAWHRADGRLDRFRAATKPGYMSRGDDDPPLAAYPPLVEEVGPVALAVSTYGEARGATRVEVRDIVLDNRRLPETGQRPLTALVTEYETAGWPLRLYAVDAGERRSQAALLATLTMEGVRRDRGRLLIGFRDRALDADTPVLTATYPGTGGAGGTADMTDRTRERSWGLVPHAEPQFLDIVGGKHLYGVNGGGRIKGFLEVRDRMALLDEVTGTPGSGEWSQDRATGIVTVGGNPELITARWEGDMTDGVYAETAADIMAALAIEGGFADAGTVTGAAALNVLAPHPVHLWLPAGDRTSYRAAWDALAATADGYWLFDEHQRFSLGAVTAPAGEPSRWFVEGKDTPGLVPRQAADRGVPVKTVRVGWGRNYRTMSKGDVAVLHASVTADVIAFAGADWRYAQSPADPATEAACPIARTVERQTLCSTEPGAAALAARLQADLRTPRAVWDLPTLDAAGDVRLLDTVGVLADQPGYEAGRLVRVIGRRLPGADADVKNTFAVRE